MSTGRAARFQANFARFSLGSPRALSLSPTRLHSAVNLDCGASDHSRLIAGASVFFPADDQISQAMRIDFQGVAHILEGKRSATLVGGRDEREVMRPTVGAIFATIAGLNSPTW